jgi:two-component system OmpR family sensor kinase
VLAALGLVASDVATLTSLHSYLTRRLDQQLQAARVPFSRRFIRGDAFPTFPANRGTVAPGTNPAPTSDAPSNSGSTTTTTPGARGFFPNDFFTAVLDTKGHAIATFPATYRSEQEPPPQLPALPIAEAQRRAGAAFEVGAVGQSSFRYRAVVQVVADRGTFVLASPLRELNATVHRVFVIEVVVTLGVLAGLAVLALWLVRSGLRPLDEMAATAAAIAEGDLSRRVQRADHTTEVGRLGMALNTMLGQIEAAFAERHASEGRLRRFVADASHELRTPLTSIRGYAELFRRGAASRPEDLEKAMRRIEEEAARMGVMVDDLLLLARLDQGRPLERRPVDLVRIAADAVDDAVAVEPDRPIDYDHAEKAILLGDEGRLRQVAANLLANARVHTPPGTPVHVSVRIVDGTAVLEVADEGPGLTADDAGRVFERFYRTDPSRVRSHGGAGLGLSIVAALAEAHGGRASVVPSADAGATFRVVFPLAPPDPPPANGAGHVPLQAKTS